MVTHCVSGMIVFESDCTMNFRTQVHRKHSEIRDSQSHVQTRLDNVF